MARKKYDLAVKTGTYTDRSTGQNNIKNRYENIGSVMENDDGSQFLLLKRCINLAAFPTRNNDDDMIAVSRFEVRDQNGQQAPYQADPHYQNAPPQGHSGHIQHHPAPQQHYQQAPAPQPCQSRG